MATCNFACTVVLLGKQFLKDRVIVVSRKSSITDVQCNKKFSTAEKAAKGQRWACFNNNTKLWPIFFHEPVEKAFSSVATRFSISRLFHLLWQGPNHQKLQILEMLPWKRYIPTNPWVNELMSPLTHESMSPWALQTLSHEPMTPKDHEPKRPWACYPIHKYFFAKH